MSRELSRKEQKLEQIMQSARKDRGPQKPIVMGVLNVTPDSFSDGGNYVTLDAALRQAERMVAEGADILDIGGESTHPGYTIIPDEEEIQRTRPVIQALRKEFPDVPLSLDTYKAQVADMGLSEGIDILNDIWGFRWQVEQGQSKMAATVASYPGVKVVLMHNRREDRYVDLMADMKKDLKESIDLGKRAGITEDRMILDPGIGFAKTNEENLTAVREVGQLSDFKMPVLLGISRKSIIGKSLDLPKGEREEGTMALNVYGYLHDCQIFRVHDVQKNRRALDMIFKVLYGEQA